MKIQLTAFRAYACVLVGLSAGGAQTLAQYQAPTDYYTTATGTGATLKSQLRNIISDNYWTSRTGAGGFFVPNGSGPVSRSYDAARQALPITDRDPNDTSNVLLIYTRASVSGSWDGGSTWNREHIWPQSRLNGADVGDLFNLRPCNPSVNSSRGNKGFNASTDSTYYNPGALDRGDIARSLFYMATRYASNLSLGNTAPGTSTMGNLDYLLRSHYEDVPDTFEQRRNHTIFSNSDNPSYYQGNRNAYVDRPEYVWSVFGDGANDSKIYIGTSAAGSGQTTTLDLGRVLVGQSAPTGKTVNVGKVGTDPTYFEVRTTSGATASLAGRNNAFTYNAQSTRSMTVGLGAGTSSVGLKSGSVVVDNLDASNQGAGTGSLDADDTIAVQYAVLSKRQVTAGTVQLGRVIVGCVATGTSMLKTTGSVNERTNVNVASSSTTDANGMRISNGTGTLFDAEGDTGLRTVTGTFNTPGAKSGTLQLSVTTAENGGAGLVGEGSYTPTTVSYSATALSHARPSFETGTVKNSLSLDFGQLALHSSSPTRTFLLANALSGGTPLAGLELDGITPAGQFSTFASDLAGFRGTDMLAGGDFESFQMTMLTDQPGVFTAAYTLSFSDEDLPGAASSTMILNVRGEVMVPEPATMSLLALGTVELLRRRRVLA